MKALFVTMFAAMFALASHAQRVDIDLWPNGLPNSNGIDKTLPFDDATRNFKPTISVYLPENPNGMAIVCCPGGGYSHLAQDHEGHDWAKFYNDLGIAFIMLRYRMPHAVAEVPISDAKEALRVVRENAEKWHIDPLKVGIQGSSAGGHLASTVATHSDEQTAPNFQVLFYPVVSMVPGVTHQGSRDNLLGRNVSQEMEELYSNATQVNEKTSPAILLLADDDGAVIPQNSAEYYLALKKAGVKKCAIHVYPSGGHGFGFRSTFRYHNEMLADLSAWLKNLYK